MAERRRRQPGDLTFLSPAELERVLDAWDIDRDAIERVHALLGEPDPAGIAPVPSWGQVAHVAVYLHRGVAGARFPHWTWMLMERGHPAARALWWHEVQELECYWRIGVRSPLQVEQETSEIYWQAHAWACWQEAHYWQAWGAAEARTITREAFAWANPMRQPRELREIVAFLRETWQIDARQPPVLELRRAGAFYRDKQLTPQQVERWLKL
jgi:hypothetical protein